MVFVVAVSGFVVLCNTLAFLSFFALRFFAVVLHFKAVDGRRFSVLVQDLLLVQGYVYRIYFSTGFGMYLVESCRQVVVLHLRVPTNRNPRRRFGITSIRMIYPYKYE